MSNKNKSKTPATELAKKPYSAPEMYETPALALAENIRNNAEFLLSKIIYQAFEIAKNHKTDAETDACLDDLDIMREKLMDEVGYYIDFYAEYSDGERA